MRLVVGCAALLIACSPAPDFGGPPGSTSASTTAGSSTGSGEGAGGAGTTSGGGETPAAGGGGDGGSTSGGGDGGGGGGCETSADCPAPTGPCELAVCSAGGVCGFDPRPAGTDAGACGVCQGGAYLGQCGYRLYARMFPSVADVTWTSVPLSDVLDSADAPPPSGISEVEAMQSVDRLFVWTDAGMLHERSNGIWRTPVPIAERFPGFPQGAHVALAVIWRPTEESTEESVLLTTDELIPRSVSYTLVDEGALAMLTDGPSFIEPSDDPDGPAQDVDPWQWGFVEQRGYLGQSNDWVVLWGAVGDTLHQYWGGNDDYLPATLLAEAPLAMDGLGDAPDGLTVDAAWRTGSTLHVLAP